MVAYVCSSYREIKLSLHHNMRQVGRLGTSHTPSQLLDFWLKFWHVGRFGSGFVCVVLVFFFVGFFLSRYNKHVAVNFSIFELGWNKWLILCSNFFQFVAGDKVACSLTQTICDNWIHILLVLIFEFIMIMYFKIRELSKLIIIIAGSSHH